MVPVGLARGGGVIETQGVAQWLAPPRFALGWYVCPFGAKEARVGHEVAPGSALRNVPCVCESTNRIVQAREHAGVANRAGHPGAREWSTG